MRRFVYQNVNEPGEARSRHDMHGRSPYWRSAPKPEQSRQHQRGAEKQGHRHKPAPERYVACSQHPCLFYKERSAPAPGKDFRVVQTAQLTKRQWGIIGLIAAVQFVNVLDFVMIMPMGPILAKALDISQARLGILNGSYTAAASVTGLLGAFFLDRFDRRVALTVALGGLVLGTAAGGFATDLPTLLLARVVAGAFGGPATSLSFSIISDVIPPAFRGRAMGTVMGAFSLASILGIPAGLTLAESFGWHMPFFALAALGVVVTAIAASLLPPLTGHLNGAHHVWAELRSLVTLPLVRRSYLLTTVVMMAGFVLIPNIAPFVELNLGLPSEKLKWAYLCGGLASFGTTQSAGRLVDTYGSFRVGAAGALMVMGVVFAFFYLQWSAVSPGVIYLAFVGFMVANGMRNVSYNTLASKVPAPEVRARFQSLQSAVQHAAAALAAFLSATLLTKAGPEPQAILVGMPRLAVLSMALSACIPLLMRGVERGVQAKNQIAEPRSN
jgi:predicted MFS family arabinose efflux permease